MFCVSSLTWKKHIEKSKDSDTQCDDVSYLQQPVASSVECWHNGGMDVAAVQALKQELARISIAFINRLQTGTHSSS